MPSDNQLTLEFTYGEVPQQLLTPDEMFEGLTEENLRKWVEDSRFEKKSALVQPKSLGDYFSMWSNTAPSGGIIVVGISQDNVFEGCLSLSIDKLNHLEKASEIHCPDASYTLKRINIHRDRDRKTDFVVAFRVYYMPGRSVKNVSGKVFIRRGDSLMEVKTPEELRQLQADKGEISFEKEPCGLKYPDDFQMSLVSDFADAVRTRKTWNAGHTTEAILELMHLGRLTDGQFIPTISCAILFARDPRSVIPGCRIRFLRFDGIEEGTGAKWNAIRDEFIDGTMPQQIERAASVLSSQLRMFSRLGANAKFFTSPEYPEFAWYESVVK